MIIAQRNLHARLWPIIALLLVIVLVASVLARRPAPFNPGGLPGAPAGGAP